MTAPARHAYHVFSDLVETSAGLIHGEARTLVLDPCDDEECGEDHVFVLSTEEMVKAKESEYWDGYADGLADGEDLDENE